MIIKNHFHKKGFALGLVLKQRLAASRKWPIPHLFLGSDKVPSCATAAGDWSVEITGAFGYVKQSVHSAVIVTGYHAV